MASRGILLVVFVMFVAEVLCASYGPKDYGNKHESHGGYGSSHVEIKHGGHDSSHGGYNHGAHGEYNHGSHGGYNPGSHGGYKQESHGGYKHESHGAYGSSQGGYDQVHYKKTPKPYVKHIGY